MIGGKTGEYVPMDACMYHDRSTTDPSINDDSYSVAALLLWLAGFAMVVTSLIACSWAMKAACNKCSGQSSGGALDSSEMWHDRKEREDEQRARTKWSNDGL